MSSIRVKVSGDKRRLMKRLQLLANVDIRGINKAIAEGIRTSTVERFRTEKDRTERNGRHPSAQEMRVERHLQILKLKTSIQSTASMEGFGRYQ